MTDLTKLKTDKDNPPRMRKGCLRPRGSRRRQDSRTGRRPCRIGAKMAVPRRGGTRFRQGGGKGPGSRAPDRPGRRAGIGQCLGIFRDTFRALVALILRGGRGLQRIALRIQPQRFGAGLAADHKLRQAIGRGRHHGRPGARKDHRQGKRSAEKGSEQPCHAGGIEDSRRAGFDKDQFKTLHIPDTPGKGPRGRVGAAFGALFGPSGRVSVRVSVRMWGGAGGGPAPFRLPARASCRRHRRGP